MARRNRNIVAAIAAALALLAFVSPDRRADIQILAHRQGDLTPQKVQAVVDLGLVAVSVLVTWSHKLDY